MTKQGPDYDPENGNWYYEMRNADGSEVLNDGKIEMCIGCHSGGSSTDYLLGMDVRSGQGGETPGNGLSGYEANYETNGFFTRTPEMVVTAPPHERVRIFYSDDLSSVIDLDAFEAPVGATSVKEAFDEDENVANILVMTKQAPGYDPDNGDWYYEMRNADGTEILNDGRIEMCIGCHTGGAQTDYLLGMDVRSEGVEEPNPVAATSGYTDAYETAGFFTRTPEMVVTAPPHERCLLYTSPSPRDATLSRMPSSA